MNPFTGEIIESFANDSSPAWALEDYRDISGNDAGEQKFSYKDARQYFYDALTKPDKADRDKYWGLTFQTLGQVIHHLQDMAQPQHVRNDAHLDQGSMEIGGEQLNPLFNPSRFELWTFEYPPVGSLFSAYAPVYSPDDTGGFAKPRQFWTTTDGPGTGGNGIAEYTSRGFFSAGTLFSSPAFPYPTFSSLVRGPLLDIADVCAEAEAAGRPPCPPDLIGKITFFANTVGDSLRSSGTGTNMRAASYSLFDQDLEQHDEAPIFALNRFNFDSALDFLIPRAVAYSAGLINYFFRGRMEISLPVEGVYALADHALPEVYTNDTGGFRTVKLKLRNTTPAASGTEPMAPESGTPGKLQAVIKFHRNGCYEGITLRGQPGGPFYQNTCRTVDEEIVASSQVDADANIDAPEGQAVTFQFQNAIPTNATDVYLQVVYRGPLGQEADAVAVATKDISEPTFLNVDNYSDCYRTSDGTYYEVTGSPVSFAVTFNGSSISPASVSNLAAGSYSRMVLLTDNYQYFAAFADSEEINTYSFDAIINQETGVADNIENPTRFRMARSTTDGGNLYGNDGYGYYGYNGSLYVYNNELGYDDAYLGAQGCTAIEPAPQPMSIVFE